MTELIKEAIDYEIAYMNAHKEYDMKVPNAETRAALDEDMTNAPTFDTVKEVFEDCEDEIAHEIAVLKPMPTQLSFIRMLAGYYTRNILEDIRLNDNGTIEFFHRDEEMWVLLYHAPLLENDSRRNGSLL